MAEDFDAYLRDRTFRCWLSTTSSYWRRGCSAQLVEKGLASECFSVILGEGAVGRGIRARDAENMRSI